VVLAIEGRADFGYNTAHEGICITQQQREGVANSRRRIGGIELGGVQSTDRSIDQCIKVRNQMSEIQKRTPDRAA
jgi:hypothetical protein